MQISRWLLRKRKLCWITTLPRFMDLYKYINRSCFPLLYVKKIALAYKSKWLVVAKMFCWFPSGDTSKKTQAILGLCGSFIVSWILNTCRPTLEFDFHLKKSEEHKTKVLQDNPQFGHRETCEDCNVRFLTIFYIHLCYLTPCAGFINLLKSGQN